MDTTEQQDGDANTSSQDKTYLLNGLSSNAEFERLDAQARAIWQLFGGTHNTAPVSQSASLLLDIGCGTGAVTISLGLKHPNAEVVGVDLSAIPPIHKSPPNVTYLEGNIFDLAGKDPRLQPSTADLVHSRLLVLGLKSADWPKYMKTLFDLAKPGGYVELTEMELNAYASHDYNDLLGTRYLVTESEQWLDVVRKRMFEMGMNPNAGADVEQAMKDAGLVDVKVKVFPWAYGTWIGKYFPDGAAAGKLDQSVGITALIENSLRGTMSEEKIQGHVKDAERYFSGVEEGRYKLIYNVVGRKPT